jgi:hypothetical protein
MARAYVGPLCRVFAGERGEPATFVAGVEEWRRDLQEALGKRLAAPLQWPEDPADAGAWFELGDSGLIGLRLFAFYAEKSDLELPDAAPALLELDREFRAAQDQKFERSKYGHLLAAQLWLPADFPFTARIALPDGEAVEMGSLPALRDQLRWLNQRTFQADEALAASWAALAAPAGGPLIPAAQRGFAGLWAAVEAASSRGLPLWAFAV